MYAPRFFSHVAWNSIAAAGETRESPVVVVMEQISEGAL